MWDYSWLMCGHPGGAYADLEACVAGAVERGYNTLRVDVFPHLYGRGEHTFPGMAQRPRVLTWGSVTAPEGYTVDVRREVLRLADLCRKHGLRLALDTWQSGGIINEQGKAPLGQEEAWTRRIADAWCAAFVWKKTGEKGAPEPPTFDPHPAQRMGGIAGGSSSHRSPASMAMGVDRRVSGANLSMKRRSIQSLSSQTQRPQATRPVHESTARPSPRERSARKPCWGW